MDEFGLTYVDQLNLQNSGLVHREPLVMEVDGSLDLGVAGAILRIVPKSKGNIGLRLLNLTPIGAELIQLADPEPHPEFIQALAELLAGGFKVTRL